VEPVLVLDSLPYGMDMDETLQPEVSPSEWIHTAPIQDLLARGDPSPEPAADAKGPTAPATEVASEDTGGLGVGHYIHACHYSRECSRYPFEKEQCLLSQRYDAIWQ